MTKRTEADMQIARANEQRYREIRNSAQRGHKVRAIIALSLIAAFIVATALALSVSVSTMP